MSRAAMLVAACGAVLWLEAAASAIDRSWDDDGGTLDKNWSSAGNWSPDGVPLVDDDVFIGNLAAAEDDTTIFDLPSAEIGSLALTSGADVDTDGNQLVVHGATTLSGAGTSLIVSPHLAGLDSFVTNTLAIDNDAGLLLQGGSMSVGLTGPPGMGMHVIDGLVSMSSGTDTITALAGNAIAFGDDSGSLDARLEVSGAGRSSIYGPLAFFSDADVEVAAGSTLWLGGDVTFHSANGADHAEFTGDGILAFGNNVTVLEDTTIDMPSGRVDLDGLELVLHGFGQSLTIHDATYTLNVAGIDVGDNTFGKNNFVGRDTININGAGKLEINLTNPDDEWTLAEPAVLNISTISAGMGAVSIAGSDFNLAGTANVSGNSASTARVDISGTITTVDAASSVRLLASHNHPNRLEGGTIDGPGTLSLTNSALVGFGTIDTAIDHSTAGVLRADDGRLVVNGDILDIGRIGTADADGVLDVTNDWHTNVADLVELRGGELTGGAIDNSGGIIRGFGRITASALDNGGLIAADGGLLEIATVVNLHGTMSGPHEGDGVLQAIGGSVLVSGQILDGDQFVGTIDIGTARHVTYETGGDDDVLLFDDDGGGDFGWLNLTGGTLSADRVLIEGALTVTTASSTISADEIGFRATSSNTIDDELALHADLSVVAPGATFFGGGSLRNLDGGSLVLFDGADVDVLVENDGAIEIHTGAGPGRADVASFQQTASGALLVDLAGTGLADFDRLVVDGAAQLDGELQVKLLGGFSPALGDEFAILSAAGGVTGTFATVTLPPLDPGLALEVIYNADNVMLAVVIDLPGDYNLDGVVDAADYSVWRDALGAMVAAGTGADGDGDGIIDDDDYSVWKTNFGTVAAAHGSAIESAASVTTPEPATLTILALGCLATLGRRRAPTHR